MKKVVLTLVCFVVVALGAYTWKTHFVRTSSQIQTIPIQRIGPLSVQERQMIFKLIAQTIQDGLDGKERSYPDLNAYPSKWREEKTVYTTLYIGHNLRGYRGNLHHKKPLLHAIVDSAYEAAFQDSRFPKLTQQEFNNPDFYSYITIFGDEKQITFKNEKDIIKQLTPFQYGYILVYQPKRGGKKRGLFLPSVWKKNPNPRQFWKKLKKKAKLRETFFSNKFEVYAFSAETIRDLDSTMHQDAKRIQSALTAYKKLFLPNGHVRYEIDFKNGKPSTKENLVREMGSGYGLAYAYHTTHDKTLRTLVKQFLKYVSTITVPYKNGVLVTDNPEKISAGASALALLAVLYYEQESQDTKFQQLRKDLKNGLVALFKPGIGIYKSPTEKETSPYYDGETWLALTMYHIFHPQDTELAQIIPELNQTMYDKYSDKYLSDFFHWGTQAAAHQYAKTQDPMMYDFLKKQLNIYIDTIAFRAGSSSCAYAEGLAEAALALNKNGDPLYKKVLGRLEDQLDAARLLQDALLNQKQKISPKTKEFIGLFLNKPGNLKTRNDITQHCLSALLKAQLVFREVP